MQVRQIHPPKKWPQVEKFKGHLQDQTLDNQLSTCRFWRALTQHLLLRVTNCCEDIKPEIVLHADLTAKSVSTHFQHQQ